MKCPRIGILGGTFNPVHKGHLYIAGQALKKLRLDKVIFVPAYIPPHKKIEGNVTASDRLRMLGYAIRGKTKFEISEYEIRKKGKSYSIQTARFFRRKFGKKTELFFLVGADSFKSLLKWKNVKSLFKLWQFAVIPRKGYKIGHVSNYILALDIPTKDISSSGIRALIRKGKPIMRLVPEEVAQFIKEQGLYLK